jgi:ADP-heptose:LPS heptosyltransferase
MLEQHPDLNEVVPFNRGAVRKNWLKGSLEFTRFLHRLRGERYDLTIDLQGLFRTGMMTLATGAPVRIGLASAREGAALTYTHRVEDRIGVRHAVDRYWRVVELLGDAPATKRFYVPIHSDARTWAESQLKAMPRPWVAVGVGSRWLTKRWPPAHFAALATRAQVRHGGSVIFVGTPDETPLADQAAAAVYGPKLQLTGKTTLPQLVALLGAADVLLANDTGPLHLAVALGRPVVAPYTCTLIERTGPYAQAQRAVATSVECKGSYLKICPHMKCMADLTPERLWPALETILQSWQQRTHAA